MDFLAMDKIFCHGQKFFVQDNLGFVLDKSYFVRAEGPGMSAICSAFSSAYILFARIPAQVICLLYPSFVFTHHCSLSFALFKGPC